MNDPTIRTYVLILNSADPALNFAGVAQYIRDANFILGWANHIPYTFFLKTQLVLEELSNRLRAVGGQGGFLLFEVNPFQVHGYMPKVTWDWFYAEPPKPALSAIEQLALSLNRPK